MLMSFLGGRGVWLGLFLKCFCGFGFVCVFFGSIWMVLCLFRFFLWVFRRIGSALLFLG